MRLSIIAAAVSVVAALMVVPLPASAATSGNLIVNGDAETGQCTTTGLDTTTLPGWSITSGGPDAVCYGAPGYPNSSTPGPGSRGNAFFAGGSKGNAQIQQVVDVSSAASAISGGGVTYSLSGWLGGYSSQTDNVGVVATFEGASGTSLGTASIGPVTNTARNNTTELLSQAATGTVPASTTRIVVQVNWTYGAGNSTDGYLDDLALTLSTAVTAPVLTPPPSNVPHFDHVFFVYMENENENASEAPANSGDYIVGNPAAPYLNNTVAPMGALLTDVTATQHPSDPNYVAVAGASAFNLTANVSPGQVSATNLADQVNAAGLTWKGYADGMSGNCDETNHDTQAGGYYFADDEPFMDFADNTSSLSYCQAHNQPLTKFNTDLQSASTTPAFVWFAANDYQDMELGGVASGDSWLSGELPHIFSSPAWTTQNSLLVITWDEGYTKSYGPSYPNNVPAYVIASKGQVKAGSVSNKYYDDYSLTATIEQALSLAPMNANDEYAQSVDDVWTGTGGGNTVTVANPGAQAETVGTLVSLQLTGSDSASGQTLTWSATGLPAGLSIGSGSGLISGTPTTAGSYTVTAKATDATGASGAAVFADTVSPSGGGWTVPIANPGAETGSCSTTGSGTASNVQAWTVTSGPLQICYGASGGFPTAAQGPQAPDSPGGAFFGGGNSKSATMTQTVDVSARSSQINTGTDSYSLSAWLGGYTSQSDNVGLVATFLSSSGASLGTATLAAVTPAERANLTELLKETATGTVPAGTTSIRFVLTYTRSSGTSDDGYADDVAMILG